MLIGSMDRRITLQTQSPNEDEYGQLLKTWSDVATVWASYKPANGAEKLAQGEVKASISAKFQIRYSETVKQINPTWRLVFEGKNYDIAQVNLLGRNVGFEILAIARAE